MSDHCNKLIMSGLVISGMNGTMKFFLTLHHLLTQTLVWLQHLIIVKLTCKILIY